MRTKPSLRDPHVTCPVCGGVTTCKTGETKDQTLDRHVLNRPYCRYEVGLSTDRKAKK